MRTVAGEWRIAGGAVALDRPRILGILNVTPDSFSDGGRYATLEAALARAEALIEEGADLIDLGGESTRPGARAVDARGELDRVLPVLREIVRRWPSVPVSIDTVKGEVARAALAEGAAAINDVSGLRLDPMLAEAVAEADAGVIVMHSRGEVERMARYETAEYGPDPVGEMVAEFEGALEFARAAGIGEPNIVVDPGLGFSKRTEHSVAAVARLDRFLALGHPVLLGPSRKRFVGELSGGLPADDRLEGTLAVCVVGLLRGARLFRVHDVRAARRALDVAEAIRTAT